jgi:hypothetical protein
VDESDSSTLYCGSTTFARKQMLRATIFPGRPDVLDLILKAETPTEVSIEPIVSAFGKSEERFFYYRDVPLGIVGDLMPYHNRLGSFSDENMLVLLAPAQSESVPFPEITRELFKRALTQFLTDDGTDWTLICERDCAQESMLCLGSA